MPCYDLLSDTTLDKLPLRKRDGARVVDIGRNAHRLYCESEGVTYIKRQGGIEQQFRHKCKKYVTSAVLTRPCFHSMHLSKLSVFQSPPSCDLSLFYRHTSTDENVTFIFPGVLRKSGEKPVTTEKPELLKEEEARKKRKVRLNTLVCCCLCLPL